MSRQTQQLKICLLQTGTAERLRDRPIAWGVKKGMWLTVHRQRYFACHIFNGCYYVHGYYYSPIPARFGYVTPLTTNRAQCYIPATEEKRAREWDGEREGDYHCDVFEPVKDNSLLLCAVVWTVVRILRQLNKRGVPLTHFREGRSVHVLAEFHENLFATVLARHGEHDEVILNVKGHACPSAQFVV